MRAAVQKIRLPHSASARAVHIEGAADAPVLFMTHSLLTTSAMWDRQADLLVRQGWRVVRADTRGHGGSDAPPAPYSIDDLVADVVGIWDALGIVKAHYLGLSLGGMTGFGLGIQYPDRLLSLCLCDARADAPADFAAPWDERIAVVQRQGCAALATPTTERWFGKTFLDAHPDIAAHFREMACATATEGLVGCARAIQGLNYLKDVHKIKVPTTLIVGANDAALPQAMQHLQGLIAGAKLTIIPGAGHLPNIDQADAFDKALLDHLAWSRS